MAFVVLLRGINVGGQRTFGPSALAEQLKHLDAVNIGAAGTFVIRQSVSRAQLRDELARRLPFDADIVICNGREVVRLLSRDFFSHHRVRPDMVRFVSVLSRLPRCKFRIPQRRAPDVWRPLRDHAGRSKRFQHECRRPQPKSGPRAARPKRAASQPTRCTGRK